VVVYKKATDIRENSNLYFFENELNVYSIASAKVAYF